MADDVSYRAPLGFFEFIRVSRHAAVIAGFRYIALAGAGKTSSSLLVVHWPYDAMLGVSGRTE
jgi:hypothetical protein